MGTLTPHCFRPDCKYAAGHVLFAEDSSIQFLSFSLVYVRLASDLFAGYLLKGTVVSGG